MAAARRRRAPIEGTIEAMQVSVLFKLIHILAVISAVGANATYQFWYSRAGRDREKLVWVIENVRLLDRRIANPSYVVAFVAGVLTVLTGSFSFESLWVALSIVIYIVVAVIGIAVYAPAVRRQQALAQTDPTSAEYQAVARRTRMLGGTAMLLVLAIVVLMVVKPTI
jgi:uncharacterized membrane protein